MRTIKFDLNSLDQAKQREQAESIPKNMKDIRKRMIIQRKLKSSETTNVIVDTKQNSPKNNDTRQKDHPDQLIKTSADKTLTEQNSRPSRVSLKLPTINNRIISNNNYASLENFLATGGADIYDDNHDTVIQNGRDSINGILNSRHKSVSKNIQLLQNQQEQLGSNFLKYMQIKSMKPSEKVPQHKSDLSVRELKPLKIQRLVSTKIAKISQEKSLNKIQLGRSEKMMRIRKTQQKSEKVISTHSVKKQKKSISITQPIRKKITNSYWNFCEFLCLLNKIQRPETPTITYKAYIGKGNNSILIKNSLKNRFWWNLVDDSLDVNLYWTQLRDNKFIQTLKSYAPQQELQFMIQSGNSSKKIEFLIAKQTKDANNQKGELLKQYVGNGLCKFLSNDEKKRLSKSSYQVELIKDNTYRKMGNPNKNRIHNHLQNFWHLSNKKALYYNLKKYYQAIKDDPFVYIPLTFHVQKHGDAQWEKFAEHYHNKSQQIKKKNPQTKGKKKKQKNLWIVKPGQNSNQGCGIQVFDSLQEIAQMVKNNTERPNGRQRSYIVQRYLMPFLYCKRKFDIRCYVLFTSVNGIYKAYWYEQGYIRTSSKQFTLKNLKNRFIHLTNDAVQKKSQDYGKYENGNKLSYADFQKYLDINHSDKDYQFFNTVYPAMIKRATDAVKSTCMLLDPNKRQFTFEILGLDFMIDQEFQTWLIEVNTNPCLELGAPLLARIIPNMIQNALKVAVDPLFPPPKQFSKNKTIPTQVFESNKFTLIFNSSEQQQILINLTKDTNLSNIFESDEQDDRHDDEQQ